jgi:hypothetical protein
MTERQAGQFAQERFRQRKRAWLRRIRWLWPIAVMFYVGLCVAMGLIVGGPMPLFWGLGLGAAIATVLWSIDSPPSHIERWREGADGEKATAKALRGLVGSGWTLSNDIDWGRGNIDHVLVGPAGIFVLETKKLRGICRVQRGMLSVRWREDPEDGYENHSIGPRTRVASAALAETLRADGLRRHWVQGVVVLWADFEQRSVASERVAWIRGKDLARVLAARPSRLSPAEVERTVEVLKTSPVLTRQPIGA